MAKKQLGRDKECVQTGEKRVSKEDVKKAMEKRLGMINTINITDSNRKVSTEK